MQLKVLVVNEILDLLLLLKIFLVEPFFGVILHSSEIRGILSKDFVDWDCLDVDMALHGMTLENQRNEQDIRWQWRLEREACPLPWRTLRNTSQLDSCHRTFWTALSRYRDKRGVHSTFGAHTRASNGKGWREYTDNRAVNPVEWGSSTY